MSSYFEDADSRSWQLPASLANEDIREAIPATVNPMLIISSPPYMNRDDPEDPLNGYRSPVASYEHYIAELASIYVRLGTRLAPDGALVVQLQNLHREEIVTPLAFDLVSTIGERLDFRSEEVTLWVRESYGYSHGYCLIYRQAKR